MINLWQLQVFLVVYETGSFSSAATRLHMTQPGVSQQIRSLETHLGTQLFVRRGHGVELTAAGGDLMEPARHLLNLSETTERTLMSRRGEVSGRIRLACAIASAPFILNNWLAEFQSQHPDVTLQVEDMEPGPMLGALRGQELDGGFVLSRMRGRGLVHHKIAEDPMTLIVPLNHAWSSPSELARTDSEYRADGRTSHDGISRHDEEDWMPAVRPSMLKDQPMVLEHSIGESRSDARRALNDSLEERGLSTRELRVVLEVPSPAAVACAVAAGLGIGLVPDSVARRFIGQVVPVHIEGLALKQHVYLIRDRKALHSPAVGAWWKYITAKVQQAEPVKQAEPGRVGSIEKQTRQSTSIGAVPALPRTMPEKIAG